MRYRGRGKILNYGEGHILGLGEGGIEFELKLGDINFGFFGGWQILVISPKKDQIRGSQYVQVYGGFWGGSCFT